LSGVVRDEKTQIGINNATIIIMDATTQQVIRRVKTGAKGKYAVGLPNKTASYDVAVIADGYPKDIKQLPVSEAESEQAYHVDFALPSIPPIVAANTPRPATPSNPNPSIAAATPPTPPKPKPQLPPIAQIAPAPPLRISTPTSRPTPERITPVEDPYSFVGVAKNNLIFLLDVSGSMDRPDRLPLFKKSLRRVIEYMRPEDRISVIVYSGEVQTVIEGMSAANREEILRIIDNLAATGETRARSGVRKAYEVAKNNFIPDGNNRILLATDGDFLVDDVISVIDKKGTEGVALSVFAFGKQSPTRTNDMQRLAQAGNGNFALITFENADEALLNEAKAVRALK
jgi:Mg-chelatase subunit ChlD